MAVYGPSPPPWKFIMLTLTAAMLKRKSTDHKAVPYRITQKEERIECDIGQLRQMEQRSQCFALIKTSWKFIPD